MAQTPTYPIDGYELETRLPMNAVRCHDEFEVYELEDDVADPDDAECPTDPTHAVSPMFVSETPQVGQIDVDREFFASGTGRYEYELEH